MNEPPAARDPIKIDIWSDVACPWCYIGKRRLEAALESFNREPDAPEVLIEYHSFELMPDMPADYTGTHDAFLAARMGWSEEQVRDAGQRLADLGAPLGITYDNAAMQMTNTLKAHQLLHYAKAHGKQAEMKERLLRAYFTEGRHVGRTEELGALAAEIGLDRDDAVRALKAEDYRDAVAADIAQASRYGIRGVPFYVVDGKYGISGAQEPATFLEALTTVAAERTDAA